MLIVRGGSQADVQSTIQQRFPFLPVADVEALYNISYDMVQAGSSINGMDPATAIDLGLIPVNPALFGQDPGGRRIQLVAEAEDPLSGKSLPVYYDLATDDLLESILQDIEQRVRDWVHGYDRVASYYGRSEADLQFSIRFVMAQRKY
jgi:hypothetical protein